MKCPFHESPKGAPGSCEPNRIRVKAMAKKARGGWITIDRELCKGCHLCVSVCPKNLIVVSDRLNQKGYSPAECIESESTEDRQCTACATCATICPDLAIEVYRE